MVRRLKPPALAGEQPRSRRDSARIADPQAQGGGGASTRPRRRAASDARRSIPFPHLGFVGAAVLDGQGQLVGIAAIKLPAWPARRPREPERALVPAETVAFLDAPDVSCGGREAASKPQRPRWCG